LYTKEWRWEDNRFQLRGWHVVMAIAAVLALLVPGIRRFAFAWVIRNRWLRNIGLNLFLATPFVRDRILNRIMPGDRAGDTSADPDAAYTTDPDPAMDHTTDQDRLH
jgi:hypothetical protein